MLVVKVDHVKRYYFIGYRYIYLIIPPFPIRQYLHHRTYYWRKPLPSNYALSAPGEAAPDRALARVDFLTRRRPPSRMMRASTPRMTPRVTRAPMTPATGLVMLLLSEDLADEALAVELEAQVPSVLPQVVHQSEVLATANLLMPVLKSFQLMVVWLWPNRG